MSDIKSLREKIAGLSEEQMQQISGGSCSVNDYLTAMDQLTNAYETLIDFTSYVIERVAGS